jgi:hypothetical protein
VVCLGPRVPVDSVGPRPLSDVVGRPLNFTVRLRPFPPSFWLVASAGSRA